MTVPEYEARFGKLSKYAPDLVNTEKKRCQRFRKGLSSKVSTRLTTYEYEEYARLVEMARRVGKDVQDYNDNRESYKKNKTEGAAFGKSGGGNCKDGGQKSQFTKTQDVGKSQGGFTGWWKGKSGHYTNRQTVSGATTMSRQCFSCRSTDHLKRDCPRAMKSIKCYTCGEFGHMAAQCPRAPMPTASSVDKSAKLLNIALAISTPVGVVNVCYASYFLSEYHAVMDCFSKEVIFQLPNSDEVKFYGDSVVSSTCMCYFST
ncbi:hypothetical protein RHGRI_005093 [Rhododendron griersonianum]|uniref:CCHC-type domain-containing protein n=1 Tax=Rhododendron griersonianum TaxID=479676 RepID=A0AAV6LDP5_9ERIC|nr:hypothetical protein RHGRI_005093 [Rhododendron griersonianum]